MFRLLLLAALAMAVLVGMMLLVDALSSGVRRRQVGGRERSLNEQTHQARQRAVDAIDAVERAHLGLLRAREVRVLERIAEQLAEPDLDRLPSRQVAGLLIAAEDVTDTGRAISSGTTMGAVEGTATPAPQPEAITAYEAALAHAELVSAAADRDLRAARLAGDDQDESS